MVARRIRGWALAAMLASATPLSAADLAGLAGTWKGPWYIGMSSGMATLEVAADGAATLVLTNMDEFGGAPAPLSKESWDGKTLRFNAAGANGTPLVIAMQSENDGRKLRGNGKYAGFGARLELQKAE